MTDDVEFQVRLFHIMDFYSKVEEFRTDEKYADVTIVCQDKIFKCHRVILATASKFFDTMFSSQFKESTDSEIALPETNVETLEEVIQFIYTGYVSVTSSNVNSLLEASEFFGLPGITDLCTKFIETHKIGVRKTLNAFVFALRTSKQVLVNRLSKDIVEHFKIFSRANEFLEIPFEGLQTILSQWSSPNTEEVKIGAIVRWVSHNHKGRVEHVYDLVKMIRFGNVTSDEYIQLVFAKLLAEPDNTGSFTESLKPIGWNDILETLRETEVEKKLLRVYVKSTEDNSMRVFSVNDENICTIDPAKNLLNSSSYQWIRGVSLNNYLYCLEYCRRGPNAEPSDQVFSIHTSADMMGPSLSLTPPPLIFGDVSVCALRNNIYAYHKTIFRQLTRTSYKNLTPFNDEEIQRGIYVYNCELDNWFPVPAMKRQLQESCMASWNDQILYLIDGADNETLNGVQYAQAYDCRVGIWQELPTRDAVQNFTGGDCCVHKGEILVCGGGHAAVQSFDPIACKWRVPQIRPWPMCSPMKYHRVISDSNKLWAVGSLSEGDHTNNLSSVQFNSSVYFCSWTSLNILKQAAENTSSTTGIIVDAVIF